MAKPSVHSSALLAGSGAASLGLEASLLSTQVSVARRLDFVSLFWRASAK